MSLVRWWPGLVSRSPHWWRRSNRRAAPMDTIMRTAARGLRVLPRFIRFHRHERARPGPPVANGQPGISDRWIQPLLWIGGRRRERVGEWRGVARAMGRGRAVVFDREVRTASVASDERRLEGAGFNRSRRAQ